MKDPIVKYTVLALIFTFIWTIIEHFLGYNTNNHAVGQYTRLLPALVYYICIVLAIVAKKKRQYHSISFKKAFQTGALVAAAYSVLTTVWLAVYAEILNPLYKPTLIDFERNKLEAKHASPEVIAAKMKEVDLSSGGSALSYLLLFGFFLVFGLAIAAITSFIVKRRRPTGVKPLQ